MSVTCTMTLSIQSVWRPLRKRKSRESMEERLSMGCFLPIFFFVAFVQRQPDQVFQFGNALVGDGADEDMRNLLGQVLLDFFDGVFVDQITFVMAKMRSLSISSGLYFFNSLSRMSYSFFTSSVLAGTINKRVEFLSI